MKIKCTYCEGYFNDTEEKCPNCGAVNEAIVRTVTDQPKTIEELKQWYQDRKLPPQETTRFFIGVNYTEPKAFGIYKDEKTGKCIVYKNKASGERAIRYQGTDEAYAVNELYMRLKQEIIEQKMANTKKSNSKAEQPKKKGLLRWLMSKLLRLVGLVVGLFAFIILLGFIIIFIEPKEGYYSYNDTIYYRDDLTYNGESWYVYEEEQQEWSSPKKDSEIPKVFKKKKTCKPYFVSEKWKESLGCTDFEDSVWAADLEIGVRSKKGYYLYDNMVYYLYNDSFYDWYVYDEDWNPLDSESIPYPLNHSSKSSEYYKSKSYSNILEETDFDESIYYQDYQSINSTNDGYFHTANRVFYHMDSNYYSNWYEYTNDTWSEIEYVDLPENFEHPSSVNEFYFTPEWDASTQFSDFKDSAFYQDAHKSDDEDYDWGSDNSWDSNSTDWNSNW